MAGRPGNVIIRGCVLLYILCCTYPAAAQSRLETLNPDSINLFRKSSFFNNISRQVIGSVTRHPVAPSDSGQNTGRSELPYEHYQGKTIRNIYINQLGFEQEVTDTNNKIVVFGTKLMNKAHVDTKDWVIRNNLFIKRGDTLNAFMVADNERYLRTLRFIQDARIVIKPIPGNKDSVDIEVVTRDLFTITGGIGMRGAQYIDGNITEANLLGAGQSITYKALYDAERTPVYGHEAVYSKNSIGGTFINGTAGYSMIGRSLQDGREQDERYYLQLDRPLISPYSAFAGGVYIGHQQSKNLYGKQEGLFYDYANNTFDGWIGYNIGSKKLLNSSVVRDRRFASVRYFNTFFTQSPHQEVQGYNSLFNNRQGALAQLTFFRQNYYKTNFIYGFGITEDLPYGYNLSLTGGWYRQKDREQPYMGINADKYAITQSGDFFRLFLKAGSFLYKRQMQDAGFLVGLSNISRLVVFRNFQLRQYTAVSYGAMFNRVLTDPLRINNDFGLRHLVSGVPGGLQRISLHTETTLFLNYKLLGFRFAPFAGGDMALLSADRNLLRSAGYPGVIGGIRTRNENLVFGTIELKGVYFPRSIEGEPAFKLILKSNISYRYRSGYVSAPDFVQLNADPR